MPNKPLDHKQLALLLAPKEKQTAAGKLKPAREAPPQWGPLKYYDNERRCMSSGYAAVDPATGQKFYKKTTGRCNSPTHWELDGVPYCLLHAAYKMSDKLYELAGNKIEVREAE